MKVHALVSSALCVALASLVPSIELSPDPLVLDTDGVGTVFLTLGEPAPVGGLHVNLSASPGLLVQVPPAVVVPEGQETTSFTVLAGSSQGSELITAMASGFGSDTLVVQVIVPDRAPPQLSCPSGLNVHTSKGGPHGALVSFTVTATDLVDPAPTVVCAPPSGSFFPWGTTMVLCTATDASGNQVACTFPVTVWPTVRAR